MSEKMKMVLGSGRAKCVFCKQFIKKGTRDLTFWSNQGQTKTHSHPECVKIFIKKEMMRRLE